MTPVLSRFRGIAFLVFAAAFALCSGSRVLAATTGVPTLPNYVGPGYVINSDRALDTPAFTTIYNRWYIPARVTVNIPAVFSGSTSYYRVAFRLTDGGMPVALLGSDVDGYLYTNWQSFTPPSVLGANLVFTENLIPDTGTVLHPDFPYTLQVKRQEWNGTQWVDAGGVVSSASTYRFVHFTGGYATDTARNVRARLSSVSWAKRHAVNTDPTNTSFSISASVSLFRYDEPQAGYTGTFESLPFRITYALYDFADLSTPIATVANLFNTSTSLQRNTNAGGGFLEPYSIGFSRTVTFTPAPGVQLDSPNRTYIVVATISHEEQPASSIYVAGTTMNTVTAQLLHFNGTLRFGAGPSAVSTTMTSVTNDPTSGALDFGSYLTTSVVVPAPAGTVDGAAGYTFGGTIPVSLLANGDAVCNSGSFALSPPSLPDYGFSKSVRFARIGMTLGSGGLTSDVLTYLPSGMGWSSSPSRKQLTGTISFSGVTLDQTLTPLGTLSYVPATTMWVTEETRPLGYQASSLEWTVRTGRFTLTPVAPDRVVYHRRTELNDLAAAPVAASLRFKRSNEQYLRFVDRINGDVLFYTTSGGAAETVASLGLKSGEFRAHFPYDAAIGWAGTGRLEIDHDVNVPAGSYLDGTGLPAVRMPFGAQCLAPGCGTAPNELVNFIADGNRLTITADGGLSRTGLLAVPMLLKWGYISAYGDYAHKAGTFADGSFLMAGHFLRGDFGTGVQTDGPGLILFSGTDSGSGLVTERPKQPAYAQGFADYAGLNFRCGPPNAADSGYDGVSILAGSLYGPYDLKNRSKYYVRQGGVSGIHDKVHTAVASVDFYGYKVRLSNFGLAFLSNVNTESRTQGNLHVDWPSDIDQPFEKLQFACHGGLLSAEVPGGVNPQTLGYWQAPIDVLSIAFQRNETDQCNPGTGFLTLGVAGYASHVKETLFGTLGFLSNGNLIPKAYGLENVDSRLTMPALTHLRGPRKQTGAGGYEEYAVTPVSGAYYNQLGSAPSFAPPGSPSPTDGFITFAATFKVPFFEALKVQVQTEPNRPPAIPSDTSAPWAVSVLNVANGAWGGGSFFTPSYFDDSNRGFPTGVSNNDYLAGAAYYVHAQQKWLGGAIAFDYPLVWSTTTRTFKSPEAVKNDFVIVQMQHQVKYLSAERLELTFGAQYDGLPQINLSNFVFNAIDDTTGMAQAAVEALSQSLVDQMNDGIDSLSEMLNDQLGEFYNRLFAATLDAPGGFIDSVYQDLVNQWTGGTWTAVNVNAVLSARFNPNGLLGSLKGDVFGRLRDVSGGAIDQIDVILQHIEKIKSALDAISEIAIPSNPEVKDYTKDLAAKLVQRLATQINGNLAAILGGAGAYTKIANLLDPLLTELEPTLNQIRDVLVEVQGAFQQVREKLDPALGGAQQFLAEMRDIFQTANNLATGEFGALSSEVSASLDAGTGFLSTFGTGFGKENLLAYSPAEIKARIRQEIMDRFMATAFVTNVQVALKQQIQDLATSLTTATDSVFAQVNEAVKGVLSGALAEVDSSVNGLLGDVSQYMGAGKIDGYAYFQGDALRKVRIDGEFTWEIPEETKFKAYAEINQYTSEGDGPACTSPLPANMTATEVIIGADKVGCGFLGLDIKVDVAVKLTFEGTNTAWALAPVGVAGSFAMAEGEIKFEAFTITDLAAGVAFGKYENYITAALGMRIGSWGARGGIFFGRTCTIDPIKLWDPFAAEALGDPNPTFTGGYVYGEAHIPVSEAILGIPATCFFEISADAGLGIFYFLEGPTYGGRLGLGVNGELLCLLSVGGRIDMIGFKQGDAFKLKGRGEVTAEVGWCDFCIEVSKTIEMETTVGANGGMSGGQSSN